MLGVHLGPTATTHGSGGCPDCRPRLGIDQRVMASTATEGPP